MMPPSTLLRPKHLALALRQTCIGQSYHGCDGIHTSTPPFHTLNRRNLASPSSVWFCKTDWSWPVPGSIEPSSPSYSNQTHLQQPPAYLRQISLSQSHHGGIDGGYPLLFRDALPTDADGDAGPGNSIGRLQSETGVPTQHRAHVTDHSQVSQLKRFPLVLTSVEGSRKPKQFTGMASI